MQMLERDLNISCMHSRLGSCQRRRLQKVASYVITMQKMSLSHKLIKLVY
jgi:hypothetical protein